MPYSFAKHVVKRKGQGLVLPKSGAKVSWEIVREEGAFIEHSSALKCPFLGLEVARASKMRYVVLVLLEMNEWPERRFKRRESLAQDSKSRDRREINKQRIRAMV